MFHITSRPLVFSDVVGQTSAKKILSNVVKTGSIDNAYLFPGPHGIGKTTLARIFARALLCENPLDTGDPCNSCRSCIAHLNDTHPSYKEIDAANNSGKDDMAAILSSLSFESESGRFVILLDECHAISRAGKDALLKKLETRSDGSFVFLFCTTEMSNVPPALSSRSLPVPVRSLTTEDILSKLVRICADNNINADQQALRSIAVSSCGHMRDAEQLLRVASLMNEQVSELEVEEAGVPSLVDIAKGLMTFPRDPGQALSIFDRVMSHSGPREVYSSILYLLVEAARFGLSLEKYDTIQPAKELYKAFPRKIQSILDYILAKQRLDDHYQLRADLVTLHARYLIGDIQDIDIQAQGLSKPTPSTTPSLTTAPVSVSRPKNADPIRVAEEQRRMKAAERAQRMGSIESTKDEKPAPYIGEERTNARAARLSRD